MGWQSKKHRGIDPRQKTLPVSRRGKGAVPDESGRGLLKRHLRVAESDETPALELVACREVGEAHPVVPSPPSKCCGVGGHWVKGLTTDGGSQINGKACRVAGGAARKKGVK